jgi:predicted ATP-dependent endonuclease of OLD family
MWVSKIDLNNFRSYVSGSLELSKSINLIVGQNNSGKSTILKSVAWLQNGSPISGQDITHIPLVMEGGKELRNRCREQIVTLADGRKET